MERIYTLVILMLIQVNLNAQYFDESSLNNYCSIEIKENGRFSGWGCGFFLRNYDNPFWPILISCNHVVQGRDTVYVSINITPNSAKALKLAGAHRLSVNDAEWSVDGNVLRFQICTKKYPMVVDRNLDIAAMILPLPSDAYVITGKDTVKINNIVPRTVNDCANRSALQLGQPIFFIGFPFALGSSMSGFDTVTEIAPILRTGTIAWLPKSEDLFLLDALSFGGNSGSPAFSLGNHNKQTTTSVSMGVGNKQDDPKLIGMVQGHITDPNSKDRANAGLVKVLYMDKIWEFADRAKKISPQSVLLATH